MRTNLASLAIHLSTYVPLTESGAPTAASGLERPSQSCEILVKRFPVDIGPGSVQHAANNKVQHCRAGEI